MVGCGVESINWEEHHAKDDPMDVLNAFVMLFWGKINLNAAAYNHKIIFLYYFLYRLHGKMGFLIICRISCVI